MHENGYTHRDLKLENLVCVGDGNDITGKIIDFGVTLKHGDWEKRNFPTQGRVGTYPYMSPELCYNGRIEKANARNVHLLEGDYCYDSSKNDVWTLGHAICAFVMGVTLWQDLSNEDIRFTIATHASYLSNPASWKKMKGIRALAKAYGTQRNCMFSDDLVDLIDSIFVPEHIRPSIKKCLEHRWFKDIGGIKTISKELGRDVVAKNNDIASAIESV
eukprot:UN30761